MKGYVYALINPSLKNLVKIGRTTRNPEDRAKELSSATGVPTPFIVAYAIVVSNCEAAEKFAHEILSIQGVRLTQNREFFEVSLQEAIKVLMKCEKLYPLDEDEDEDEDEDLRNLAANYRAELHPYAEILDQARCYRFGKNDFFQDHFKAESLYKKAIDLGSVHAGYELASLYFESKEVANHNQSIDVSILTLDMIKSRRVNGLGCSPFYDIEISTLGLLASVYFLQKNIENSKKAILMIFNNYENHILTIISALKKVRLLKPGELKNDATSMSFLSDVVENYLEVKKQDSDDDLDFEFVAACEFIAEFLISYFQDLKNDLLPLVEIPVLVKNNNIVELEKLKMHYFYSYDVLKDFVSDFEKGVKIYGDNFKYVDESLSEDFSKVKNMSAVFLAVLSVVLVIVGLVVNKYLS